jgi:SAM-dependent methyltransferase
MNERDYHDLHYAAEAARIQETALFEHVHARAARQFLRSTGARSIHRVLSLGCGDGSIERRLASHVGEIVGLDISAVAIEQARAKCKAAGLGNLTFVVSESGTRSLEELGQFDVICAFALLHHLHDRAILGTLTAARKALRPGGLFFSMDPSRRRLIGLFTELVRKTYDRYHSPDERELDPEGLAGLAAHAGFCRPAIGYTDYFLGPLAWLAPATPGWLAGPLEAMDDLALSIPFVRRYASSFSLVARPS